MKKVAVIVENRLPCSELKKVIDNHFKYLDDSWWLMIVTSHDWMDAINESFIIEKCAGVMVPFNPIKTESDYNRLLTSPSFWEPLKGYDKALIFQHDSRLLRKGIENFIEWDYIGAPWGHFDMDGGNGGLSIRSVEWMIKVCETVPYNESAHGNEDVYFCREMKRMGAKIAPRHIAQRFSVETIYFPKPIGIHAAEKYLPKKQYEEIINNAE